MTPTKQQYEQAIAKLKDRYLELIHQTSSDTTEEWFIQEEIADVELKISNYTKKMNQLYV